MNTEQQKTAAEQSQQNEAMPDGRDCLHCALHNAFEAWAKRQPGPDVEAFAVGHHLGQFSAEIMSAVGADCREDFKNGHLQAQLTHLMREGVEVKAGGGHVH